MELTDKVNAFIEQAKNLRVAVVGETIIDQFIEVTYEGHSMKSFCPVFKLDASKEPLVQKGGAAAIAGHLTDFVKEVTLISNPGDEIVKTRYMDAFDKKKHVEINKFDTSSFGRIDVNTADYDVVIVADFGHGYCDNLNITDGFHLMCQTNSNNFGFNRISKWKQYRKKSITLDLREASLQMNRNISRDNDEDIAALYNYELNTEHLFVTLGGKGSLHYDGTTSVHQSSYKSVIVDTIGAGDTFLAFCTLLPALQGNVTDLTIPALAASLSTTWLCNEQSVTRQKLLGHATRVVQ